MARPYQLHQFTVDPIDELPPLIRDDDIGAAKPAMIISSEALTNRGYSSGSGTYNWFVLQQSSVWLTIRSV